MEFSRNFRCSRSFHYAPLLISLLHPIFSVLKTGLFELALLEKQRQDLPSTCIRVRPPDFLPSRSNMPLTRFPLLPPEAGILKIKTVSRPRSWPVKRK